MNSQNLDKLSNITRDKTLSSKTNESSITLSLLMRQVYIWMSLALAVTGITALYVSSEPTILYTILSNKILFWGLLIAQFGLLFTFVSGLKKMSFSMASLLFVTYTLLTGTTLSTLFLIYTSESIASTFFITAGVFGAMSLYGYYTKKDLTTMGNYLFMGLIGIIIASLVNLFIGSGMVMWITTCLGVIIFVGLTAYDTQKIKNMLLENNEYGMNENSMKLALFGSFILYLDFVNLFIKLLRLFGNRK